MTVVPIAVRTRCAPRAVLAVVAALVVPLVLAVANPPRATGQPAATQWGQFGGGATHAQTLARGPFLAQTAAARLSRAFSATLPGEVDGAPVYQAGVATSSGTRDLLFGTTTGGTTVAVDARTGAVVWSATVGPGTCTINNGSTPCYTTAQPVLNPSGTRVYAYGLDGAVHQYVAGTGQQVTGGGWPEIATRKAFDEKGSADLALASTGSATYLYVANGGYPGDRGDYQGHVTVIDLASGAQRVFNTQCSAQAVHFVEKPATPDCSQVQSAVWARPGVTFDPGTGRIYFATGNGTFDPAAGHWGDTVLALRPDGTSDGGRPLDTYTPTNYQQLDDQDLDLGSTLPTILPPVPGSRVAQLGVQSGKDARLRLLDLADLSGQHGPGHTGGELANVAVPQGGDVLTQPLAWTDPVTGTTWVVVATDNGISGLSVAVANGVPTLTPVWTVRTGGFSPVLAGRTLFYLTDAGAVALDPTSGRQLWSSGAAISHRHWKSPIVVGGWLYYTDGSGHLLGYRLPASAQRGGLPGAVSDVNGDGLADILATQPNGTLSYYRNTGAPYTGGSVVGVGWQTVRELAVGDVDGTTTSDIVATGTNGTLLLYPASGDDAAPYGSGTVIGGGWQGISTLSVADVDGDGLADLLTTWPDGSLRYYANGLGSGAATPYGGGTVLGSGFQVFRTVAAADVSGDGHADLLGVNGVGDLYYYPDNSGSNPGHLPYAGGIQIGRGWQSYVSVQAKDVDGDGLADIVATDTSGRLWLFHNAAPTNPGGFPYTVPVQIGAGWQVFDRVR